MKKEYSLPVEKPHSLTYVARNIPDVTVEQREPGPGQDPLQ